MINLWVHVRRNFPSFHEIFKMIWSFFLICNYFSSFFLFLQVHLAYTRNDRKEGSYETTPNETEFDSKASRNFFSERYVMLCCIGSALPNIRFTIKLLLIHYRNEWKNVGFIWVTLYLGRYLQWCHYWTWMALKLKNGMEDATINTKKNLHIFFLFWN